MTIYIYRVISYVLVSQFAINCVYILAINSCHFSRNNIIKKFSQSCHCIRTLGSLGFPLFSFRLVYVALEINQNFLFLFFFFDIPSFVFSSNRIYKKLLTSQLSLKHNRKNTRSFYG